MSDRVAVVGAGSWGTALANLLAKKGYETVVWSFEKDVAEAIQNHNRNPRYLSEADLDPRLRATSSLEEAVTDAPIIVSVSPSHVVRRVMTDAGRYMRDGALVISASKGIENESLQMMDAVLAEALPQSDRIAFLSGPSFAVEVAREYPTAVTMASHNIEAAEAGQELFQTEYFRVYTSEDVHGVEIGGSLKNVMAIASGAVDGLGYGHNTTAALITRGLAEMTRLGVVLGADPMTLAGLAGMGDLILTCTGGLSRNRSVGVALGKGKNIDEILGEMTMVAEGVKTAQSAWELARKHNVEMPIVDEVYAMLFQGRPAREALENLMLRDPKPERD